MPSDYKEDPEWMTAWKTGRLAIVLGAIVLLALIIWGSVACEHSGQRDYDLNKTCIQEGGIWQYGKCSWSKEKAEQVGHVRIPRV